MRTLFVLILSLFLVRPLAAEDKVVAQDAIMLARKVPEKLLKFIRRAPQAFLVEATDIIATYGAAGGLGPDGIEWMITSDRARLRARASERIVRADLDNDGAVTRDEASRLIAVTSEGARGRAETAWRQADADGNGTVSAAEIKIYADGQALRGLTDEEAVALRGYMALDRNGDGRLTVDEVTAAVEVLGDVDLKLVKKEI